MTSEGGSAPSSGDDARPMPGRSHRPLAGCVAGFLAAALAAGSPPADTAVATQPRLPGPVTAPESAHAPAERSEARGPIGIASSSSAVATFEERVLELLNEERLNNGGLPPLKGVSELFASSETHSANMAGDDFFAHCDPFTQDQPIDRMNDAGYVSVTSWAENIAAGYSSPESAMAAWMTSPGHRANILSTSKREVGVGYFLQNDDAGNVGLDLNSDCDISDEGESGWGPYFRYWTQNFGRRSGVYPVVIEGEAHDTSCSDVMLYVWAPGGVDEMRFSNDGATWSSWEPYSANKLWTLSGSASSTATVHSEVREGGSTWSAQDSIYLSSDYPAPADLVLPGQTISGTEGFVACNTIVAGDGDFVVASSGEVSFEAPVGIVLEPGFRVVNGGVFSATIGLP